MRRRPGRVMPRPRTPIAPTAPTAPSVPIALTASGTYSVAYTQFSRPTDDGLRHVDQRHVQLRDEDVHLQQRHPDHRRQSYVEVGHLTATGRFPDGTTFNFRKLSMQSRGTSTITSTGTGRDQNQRDVVSTQAATSPSPTPAPPALTVADSFGQLHVAGALTVTGNVAITATSLYADSTTATTAISNTTATAVTHNLGQVYARASAERLRPRIPQRPPPSTQPRPRRSATPPRRP